MEDYALKSERVHTVIQLLKAYAMFEKNVDYIISDDGKVKIVDEQTGRIMEGRRWSDGLHQAVEAKENVEVEAATQTFATITLQNYFRMYHKLAGMTGTAETEAGRRAEKGRTSSLGRYYGCGYVRTPESYAQDARNSSQCLERQAVCP